MFNKKTYLVSLVILVLSSLSLANTEKIFLSQIFIEGNKRTNEGLVLKELNFREGQSVTIEQIEEGITTLRETGLFSSVEYSLQAKGQKSTLSVNLIERWTTIPIVKVASGGGVQQLTLGLYDPNIFGRRLELGGQYEKLGQTNSGVVWFKDPHFFQRKTGVNFQIWNVRRLRTKYQQEPDKPVVKTGFLHQREKLFLEVDRELFENYKMGLFYEYNRDKFSDEFTSDEVKNILSVMGLPPNSIFHFVGLSFGQKNIQYKDTYQSGNSWEASYKYGYSEKDSLSDFSQVDLSFQLYKGLFPRMRWAQRFLGGSTSSEVLQYWYYLGGLDRIRGFADNRFAGSLFWLSNTEFRYALWERDWLRLQQVSFFDVVSAQEKFKDLSEVSGASVGLGLRFIFPKIYRLVARIDYAQPVKRQDDMSLSLGVQQFF